MSHHSRTKKTEEASPGFADFLGERLNLDRAGALSVLGHWLQSYTPKREYPIHVLPTAEVAEHRG